MKESILHYVWQHRLYSMSGMCTDVGEQVEVIDTGRYNTDAGPDFFNAKLKIGDTLWAGNVEIHLQSSDWIRHNHQVDKAYDSVILHVVGLIDMTVVRTDGTRIPQLQLKCPPRLAEEYDRLMQDTHRIPCADGLADIPSLFIRDWKTALLTERLESKMHWVEQLLEATEKHWEEAFYVSLARSFGFGVNSQAFQQLAFSLPLSVLAKHKDNLFQLEALLFGQAGLLKTGDTYADSLRKEYLFLQAKYGLTPMESSQWKLMRLRPDNFPQLRIAQFATLVHHAVKIWSVILEHIELDAVRNLFLYEPSEYWHTHYHFGEACKRQTHRMGQQSIDSILINTVVPFLFCYATQKSIDSIKEKAMSLLESLPAENNALIRGWKSLGFGSQSAYDSQAFIQLTKQYCNEKKCLRCRIGHKVLSAKK